MKASVIIPAYNAEKTIGQCLEALEKQAFGNFEVIVVDDGSKDKTAEIVEKFKGTKLLRQKNSGPAAARNLGAKSAKGEIIVFTDSDCIAEKNFLDEILAPFSDKRVAGVQGKYKSRQKEDFAVITQEEIEHRHKKIESKLIDSIGSYAAAYRKDVFEMMGGFDTSFPKASGEDTDLSYRISEAGYKMVFAEKAIVWHTHPNTLRKYLEVKFLRAFWRIKVYGKHKQKTVHDSYTSTAMKAQIIAMAGILIFSLLTVLALAIKDTELLLVLTIIMAMFSIIFILSFFAFIIRLAKHEEGKAILLFAVFYFGLCACLLNYSTTNTSILTQVLWVAVVISIAAIFVSSASFFWYLWKKNKRIAVIFELTLLLRTGAFLAGIVAGTIRQVRNSI
ncbi:MAG: glycosyltransferase [Candidatus ainarchaeum sp.]|nr:glycosyltransferase [Candidatus ainarchaeum sp.]